MYYTQPLGPLGAFRPKGNDTDTIYSTPLTTSYHRNDHLGPSDKKCIVVTVLKVQISTYVVCTSSLHVIPNYNQFAHKTKNFNCS